MTADERPEELIPEQLEKARAYLSSLGYNLDYEMVKEVIKAYLRVKRVREYKDDKV